MPSLPSTLFLENNQPETAAEFVDTFPDLEAIEFPEPIEYTARAIVEEGEEESD